MEDARSSGRIQRILQHLHPHKLNSSEPQQDFGSQCSANGGEISSSKWRDGAPVIIGGMVLDIHGKSATAVRTGTTVPGQVKFVTGGVARNVGECMSKLGIKPFIISAVGHDLAGDYLIEHWRSLGLAIHGIRRCKNVATPVVSNLFDSKGEIAAAVADVSAVETCMTAEWIHQFSEHIGTAPLLMIDANLHPQVLETVCKLAMNTNTPVWFEPVSVAKSARIQSIAKYVTFVSPNESELIAIAEGMSNTRFSHLLQVLDINGKFMEIKHIYKLLKPVIRLLLEQGVKFIALTLGSYGVLLCYQSPMILPETSVTFSQRTEELNSKKFSSMRETIKDGHIACIHYPALPAKILCLTGAGDCFVGGALAALCSGKDIIECIAYGVAVAKQAVQSDLNVPLVLSQSSISEDANRTLLLKKPIDSLP